jgi:ferredoxin
MIHAGNRPVITQADIVGFVFPVHGFSMPTTVRAFLKRLTMERTSYRFAVATRGGSPCHVFRHVDRILARQNQKLDAFFFIDMPNSWLLYWDAPNKEEFAEMDTRARARVEQIVESVRRREVVRDYEHGAWILENVLFPLMHGVSTATRYFRLEDAFYAEEHCTGCGVCEQVCLSGKIAVVAGRPVWDSRTRCLFCFACIHTCPHRAIQLQRTKSVSRGRYRHPDVTRPEIAAQKADAG